MEKKFYKVTDIEGKPFTLIEVTKTPDGDKVKVAEHNSAAERVKFRPVDHFNATDYTGVVTEIPVEEYADALKEWGYVGEIVDNDPLGLGEEAQGTDTVAVAAQNAEAAGADLGNGSDVGASTDAGQTVGSGEAQASTEPLPSDALVTGTAIPAAASAPDAEDDGSGNATLDQNEKKADEKAA